MGGFIENPAAKSREAAVQVGQRGVPRAGFRRGKCNVRA